MTAMVSNNGALKSPPDAFQVKDDDGTMPCLVTTTPALSRGTIMAAEVVWDDVGLAPAAAAIVDATWITNNIANINNFVLGILGENIPAGASAQKTFLYMRGGFNGTLTESLNVISGASSANLKTLGRALLRQGIRFYRPTLPTALV